MIDIEVIKDGVVEELYCNGQLKSRRNSKNGKWHGLCETFYNHEINPFILLDHIKFRTHYSNGKLQGLWEEFNENGQLKSKRNFNNGKQHGPCEEFYQNGQLRYRVNFNDHDRDGRPWEKFYRDGRRVGPWEKFYEDGRLQSRGNFIEAHTIAIHLLRILMFEHSKKYTSSQSCKLEGFEQRN